jgi:CRISPR-associated protein (TIGR02710 family)
VTRVLLQTVGTGGPNYPVWEALAFTVRERQPEVLIQLCSKKTMAETVPRFDSALGVENRPAQVRYWVSPNEEDVAALSLEYAQQIDELRGRLKEPEIEIDYTSGTKAMSAAVVAAAVARGVSRLHYATGVRDPSGRVTETTRIFSLEAAALTADPLLIQLGRLFELGEFVAVQTQASQLARRLDQPKLRDRATSLAFMAGVYDLWDRFDWNAAHEKVQTFHRRADLRDSGWDISVLDQQRRHLHACRNGKPTPERLADLLANADRRLAGGRFEDAVARLYRLTEYIGQARFSRKPFQIGDTGGAPITTLRRIAPNYTAVRLEKLSNDGRVDLGLRDNLEVLAEAGDEVGLMARELYVPSDPHRPDVPGALKLQLDARNQSLLGHGSTPVGSDIALALRGSVELLLRKHLSDYDLKLEDMLEVASFMPCPWIA